MSLTPNNYIKRLIDPRIKRYLSVHGAISIEGPKWCGKTWTAMSHSNSMVSLEDRNLREKVEMDLSYAYTGIYPELIDEWNRVPELWDDVRMRCDELTTKGNFILTCSTRLPSAEEKQKISHSGAGRIGRIMMRPMSLYEMGKSSGVASLSSLLNQTQPNRRTAKPTLEDLAEYIVRGGWPANLATDINDIGILPTTYIDSILDVDINRDKSRNRIRMLQLMKSLARNESTVVSNTTLLHDAELSGDNELASTNVTTLDDYLDVLARLHFTDNQPAFSINYRSSARIGKSAKRHLIDPSLACALLKLNTSKLLEDLNTFGLLFEALVIRDLKIYMDSLGGSVYHFRDNNSGDEIDAILEFEDGRYAAVEIKLGENRAEEAIASLQKFADSATKKPAFTCVIVGNGDFVVKEPKSGTYIVPITALKP